MVSNIGGVGGAGKVPDSGGMGKTNRVGAGDGTPDVTFAEKLSRLGQHGKTDAIQADDPMARMKPVIQQARERGLSEEETLREIVAAEVRHAFGADVSNESLQEIQEAVLAQAPLQELFGRLARQL